MDERSERHLLLEDSHSKGTECFGWVTEFPIIPSFGRVPVTLSCGWKLAGTQGERNPAAVAFKLLRDDTKPLRTRTARSGGGRAVFPYSVIQITRDGKADAVALPSSTPWLRDAHSGALECPANSVPVGVRQTGMEGAWNGEGPEAHT